MDRFEDVVAQVRAQAIAIESALGAGRQDPRIWGDWTQISFPQITLDDREIPTRALLNVLPHDQAIFQAYRRVLGRDPDSSGLTTYGEQLDSGIPILLIAAQLMNSAEGRSRGRAPRGFVMMRLLALLHKSLRPLRMGFFSVWAARALSLLFRRADAWQVALAHARAIKKVEDWRPILARYAGQLGAVQAQAASLEQIVTELRSELSVLQRRLQSESSLAAVSGQAGVVTAQDPVYGQESLVSPAALDAYYLAFEDSHRGPSEEIAARFAPYRERLEQLFHQRHQPGALSAPGADQSLQSFGSPLESPPSSPRLLDLGCGRGEFLSFAQGVGFDASGVDSSPHMVGVCQSKGLTALRGDLLSVLASQPDSSLAVVSGFHVAEHLPFSGLFYLVMQAYRALQPGGLLILETPNPENLMVATHTFYHDHTHNNPLTPTALVFLLQYLGFQRVETLRLNPYPASAQIPGLDPAAQRLNAMVNGPQDFAVVGQRLA